MSSSFRQNRGIVPFQFWPPVCKNCAPAYTFMTNPARPWTRFYHPQTATDLGALPWRNLPAAIRAAAATYATQTAFTLALPNGSQGGLTFADVDRLSDAFAVYLREVAGFAPGDRIAIQMPNCLAYPVVVFGALKAGLVMVNTNPLYTVPEMVHQFADSGATGLVVIDLFADQGRSGAAEDQHQDRRRGEHCGPAARPLRRLVVGLVQKYVKKTVPPIRFAHTTFARAHGGRRRPDGGGRRRARLRQRPSRRTRWRRCNTPAGRPAWRRRRC